jgi:outer membrane protein assembly factor BamB
VKTGKTAALLLFGVASLILLAGCPKPQAPEKPFGVTQGVRGIALACSTRAADADMGEVEYQFDWGDNSQSQWSPKLDAGLAWADTHTYTTAGTFSIKARLRTKTASAWSEPLVIAVVAEGAVIWSFGLPDPEDPEDSADFSSATVGISPAGGVAVGSDFGLAVRPRTGPVFAFRTADLDEFKAPPAFSESGFCYTGCDNDSFYALSASYTRRWVRPASVEGAAALGADGTVYFQDDDSVVALGPDGTRRWASFTAGGEAGPVIAADGTVIAINADATVFAFDNTAGTAKWTRIHSGNSNIAAPAIDQSRNTFYLPLEGGSLVCLDLGDEGNELWRKNLGSLPSSPVVGLDGTVYVTAGGKLYALDPANGGERWTFTPPMAGQASTPAVSASGIVYTLVSTGKKKSMPFNPDSLYGIDAGGQFRWSCPLGWGAPGDLMSAPKLDENGLIYIGSGYRVWCVGGAGGPGDAPWPMTGRDIRNSGRAR